MIVIKLFAMCVDCIQAVWREFAICIISHIFMQCAGRKIRKKDTDAKNVNALNF